ncbi:polycomb group RING finger protein 1-like [Dendronephthya gigantea]|uniref:polycomb group RING finger protein 1-like n=1 Tax=Dendronephthya gigantea TaxID=151771 RepID=UPI00106C7A91|nr:polycomb group RING finger protein 1-like [Dendronephthya gigantea]
MDKVVKIREINPHIVCSLCAGYFIDATTITECLHTFCRRCIVKYLQLSKYCPTCNLKVHETQPLLNVSLDRTMQDIVFKIVPNLFEDEEAKEHAFYEERGMSVPKKETEDCESDDGSHSPIRNDVTEYLNNFRDDELISLCLKPYESYEHDDKLVLSRKYLRCSHRVLILHLAKILQRKMNLPQDTQLDFLCENELVHPACSLKQIFVANWRQKALPMCLHYQIHLPTLATQTIEETVPAEESIEPMTEDTWL